MRNDKGIIFSAISDWGFLQKEVHMILFCMSHPMSLYQFLTLRFTRYKNEKVYFLMHKGTAESFFSKNMQEKGIFEKIIPYGENCMGDIEWKTWINAYFDKILEENNMQLTQFKEVIISCDVGNNFYLYCCFNNKPVTFLEGYLNQFMDRNRYTVRRVYGRGSLTHEELSKKYDALCGEHQMVNKRYLFGVENKVIDGKDEYIDFYSTFWNIPVTYKETLKECFKFDKVNFDENFNLLLLNSTGYGIPKTNTERREYYYVYQLIADYYFNTFDNVYFKNHPDSPKEEYLEVICKHEKILGTEVPIEFYALDDKFRVEKLLSAKSSSNEKIKQFVKEEITLGDSILFHFRLLHKLYVAYAYDAYLGKSKGYHCYGVDNELMTNFLKYALGRNEEIKGINPQILKGDIFAIIDIIPEEQRDNISKALIEADENTKVCFFTSRDELACMLAGYMQLVQYIVPIKISKEKLREDTLGTLENEEIFFFCKNSHVREYIKRFSLHKSLHHSGIEIYVGLNAENMQLEIQRFKILVQEYEISKLKKTVETISGEL